MQAGAPLPGGGHQFYQTQPPPSAPPQQQLIYAHHTPTEHINRIQEAQIQAMQRGLAHQQMGFPQMMGVPGQPGQHPYALHPLRMSQGPPQQPSHPVMEPPQQVKVSNQAASSQRESIEQRRLRGSEQGPVKVF